MEALDVFDSVLDCTSISDDEEEVKTVQKPPIVKKPGLNLKIDSE